MKTLIDIIFRITITGLAWWWFLTATVLIGWALGFFLIVAWTSFTTPLERN